MPKNSHPGDIYVRNEHGALNDDDGDDQDKDADNDDGNDKDKYNDNNDGDDGGF